MSMSDERLEDLVRFYSILDRQEKNIGGARRLEDCSGRMAWAKRGVYFFREPGENRTDTGTGSRILRVGTHALKTGAKTKLWTRLSQHRGRAGTGGGTHRGSIFRLIVGAALIAREGRDFPTWGDRDAANPEVRNDERALEAEVSKLIRRMPFLWLSVDDEPGEDSRRGYIERNSIALLSNYNKPPLDLPSQAWLGHDCNRERVRRSGLWNFNHVDESYDRTFLGELDRLVSESGPPS
jgi:hypothetical protein